MVGHAEPDTEVLLSAAADGDAEARDRLLTRYRGRLRQLVALRLDRRIAARIDPSDVIQETLVHAAGRFDNYLRERPLPFYPWLRQIACDRLVEVHRRHVLARRRSVKREQPLTLPDESIAELAGRLLTRDSRASSASSRAERLARLRSALDRLAERDREVLALRHLEQLSTRDTAAILGVSEGAVKVRLLRALQRLRDLLDEEAQP